MLSVTLACKPEQLALPMGMGTAGRGHTHGTFLFANVLSHSRNAVSGTCYFPAKPVIKAIGLSNYEKIIIKKRGICLMISSVRIILSILAAMKYWVVIGPVGTPQRRQKATPLWAFVPLTLSSETPSTTHRGPPKGSAPHLVIVFGSSRVNHSLQGPVLWGNMAEPTHDLKWPHFSEMNPPSFVHKHLAQWLKHIDFCVYKFNTHYTPNKASLVKTYRVKKGDIFPCVTTPLQHHCKHHKYLYIQVAQVAPRCRGFTLTSS